MFEVLILFCATGLNPAECEMKTAVDVIHGPVVAHEMMCGTRGQAFLAEILSGRPVDGSYVKIRCARGADRAAARGPSIAGASTTKASPLP